MSDTDWSQYKKLASPSSPGGEVDWSQYGKRQAASADGEVGKGILNFGGGAAVGAGQGLYDMLRSLANVIIPAGRAFSPVLDQTAKVAGINEIPPADFSGYAPQGRASEIGQTAGNIGSYLIPGVAETRLAAGLPLAGKIAASAATGYGLGGDKREEAAGIGAGAPVAFKALGKVISPFRNKVSDSNLVKGLQEKASTLKKSLSNEFDNIKDEVYSREVGEIPVSSHVINQAKGYLPDTRATQTLINKARTGDYDALHTLQADLRTTGEDALESDLMSERNLGKEALDTRDLIKENIRDHFKNSGHQDLAERLDKARVDYKNYIDTYFGNNKLAKIFGKSQAVPENPFNVFKEDSTEMNRFKAAHPEVEQQMQKNASAEKIKALGKTGVKGIGYGATFDAGKTLMELLLGG